MRTVEEIVRDIKSELDEVAAHANAGKALASSVADTEDWNNWTQAITDRPCRLGHDLGYEACGKSTFSKQKQKGYPGEWLYDVCWLAYDPKVGADAVSYPGAYTELILALESEWLQNFDDIWDDFCKLVPSRAMLRVMIFEKQTLEAVEKTMEDLEPSIIGFRASQDGDRYLFCGLWSEAQQYRFHYNEYAVRRGWLGEH